MGHLAWQDTLSPHLKLSSRDIPIKALYFDNYYTTETGFSFVTNAGNYPETSRTNDLLLLNTRQTSNVINLTTGQLTNQLVSYSKRLPASYLTYITLKLRPLVHSGNIVST